ncbi:MAG: tyrosine-type recombinase/integrase [Bacteroidota bacterium]
MDTSDHARLPATVTASGQNITVPDAQALDADLLPVYLLRFDREQTRRAYRSDLLRLFRSEFVTLRMAQQLNFVHLNAYVRELQSSGLQSSTVRRKISAIRGFYSWLIALDLVKTNPADRSVIRRVDRNSKSNLPITVLTKQQARLLVEATNLNGGAAVRDWTLVNVLLHCTLRRSEAAAMDVSHVRSSGPYWILDLPRTKGGANEYVKVPAFLVESIETMKQYYGIEGGALWRSLSRNSSRGNRMSPSAIYEVVRRTARRAGLDAKIGAHTLRHTGCTLAIESGASLQQVQTHARHKRLETTMTYVHQRDKLKDSAADYIKI